MKPLSPKARRRLLVLGLAMTVWCAGVLLGSTVVAWVGIIGSVAVLCWVGGALPTSELHVDEWTDAWVAERGRR